MHALLKVFPLSVSVTGVLITLDGHTVTCVT